MLLLEAWHAIRVLCFNSRSQSANWAMDMFRERKYPEAHETCRACLFDTRSFFASFFSFYELVSNHCVVGGHPKPSRKWGLGSQSR